MERVTAAEAAIAVRQSEELNAALQQSGARRLSSSESIALTSMVGQMIAYYPHQEMAAETVAGYMHDLTRLAVKHGLPAVKTALAALRLRPGQKFFPHPSEVSEELEAMETRERLAARAANPYVQDPNCNHISVEGLAWVRNKDGDRVLGRCACWKQWKRATAHPRQQSSSNMERVN